MFEVPITPRSPELLLPVIGESQVKKLVDLGKLGSHQLGGKRIVNINSTATGGGVAEMLPSLLGYMQGMGIDARWLVIEGEPTFFDVTKRIHHRLHGSPGDFGPLGLEEARVMDRVLQDNEFTAKKLIKQGDTVIIHDPQPAPLAKRLHEQGFKVVWRCHVGVDHKNEYTEQVWNFLRPFLEPYVDQYVFTRRAYAPSWVPNNKLHIIRPSIDPFALKNKELDGQTILSVLQRIGVVSGGSGDVVSFTRGNGEQGFVTRSADIVRIGTPPSPDTPIVVQVSRWDPLKDMAGVMLAFASEPRTANAHLVLSGPDVSTVSDDPEGQIVLDEVITEWRHLPNEIRKRISIVSLPMADSDENAVMVNALQRHATVIVQKSLHEGFGLTVTEAMYKGRPVVASEVGGIVDQIRDGADGLLLSDPTDLRAAGKAIGKFLRDRILAEKMGEQAKATVVENFLPDTSLLQWAAVLSML